MINKDLKLKAILLLIAAFSIFSIVACGGADITGSGRSYSSENTDTNGNGGNNVDGGTSTPDDDTIIDDNISHYYRIRVPFAVGGDGYTNVSYKDTSKLKQLWLDQINRKAVGDGKVFAIRNRANNRDASSFQNAHTHGSYSAKDYYYVNEDGDIVYKEDNTVIKKLVGAIITEYRDINIERGHRANFGFNDNRQAIVDIPFKLKGIYTVGAIYANTFTTEEARKKYMGDNPFKDGVFNFITYWHLVETFHSGVAYANNIFERQYIYPGFVEVLVMYDYNNEGYNGAAAVHSYYPYYGIYNYWQEYKNHPGIYFTPQNMPYMTNQYVYLAQRPEYTTPQLNHTALFTDTFRGWQFLFMPGNKDVSEIGRKTKTRQRITKRF